MQFLNPILLASGLACIAVPIVIHILMRRRRRPIRWGAMEFLLQAYRQQRKRLRFEQWLLLGSRCLLVALIALAVGKPVLSAALGQSGLGSQDLIIVLDNSLTSQARADAAGQAALENAKTRALALLDELDGARGDRAGLVLLGGPAEGVVLPASSDIADVRRRVERVVATDSRADVSGALAAIGASQNQRDAEGEDAGSSLTIAFVGDWRTGSWDVATPIAAMPSLANARITLSPAASAGADNIAVVGVRPLRPMLVGGGDAPGSPDAGLVPVQVELKRWSTAPLVTTLRAEIRTSTLASDPARTTTTRITWDQGQSSASTTLSLRAPAGLAGERAGDRELLVVANIDPDAIEGDNTAAALLAQRAAVTITLIDDPAARAARQGDGIDSFNAGDWMTLALDPRSSQEALSPDAARAGLRVQRGDVRDLATLGAARSDSGSLPAALRDSSALLIPRPDLLDASAWRGVRTFVLRGGLVMVSPPEDAQTHLWTDALSQTLGLGVELSRSVRELTPGNAGGGLAIRVGDAAASAAGGEDLLAMLRGELGELVKSVRVRRVLGATVQGDDVRALLTLEDGSPLVLATRVVDEGTPRGWVVVWTAAPTLAWTDMPAKPLMVPLMQEVVRQGSMLASGERRDIVAGSRAGSVAGARTWSREAAWRDAVSEQPGTLRSEADDNASEGPTLRNAGLWSARGDAGERLASVVVHANVEASDTSLIATTALESWLAGVGAQSVSVLDVDSPGQTQGGTLSSRSTTPPISLPLLIAAGVVALLEVVLARWFSHAKAEGARRDAGGLTSA